jgi:hypothetical protein
VTGRHGDARLPQRGHRPRRPRGAGGLLQFWPSLADFNRAKRRQAPVGLLTGHSPVLAGLLPDGDPNPQQVEIIDQSPRRPLSITEAAGQRRIGAHEIWVAAEWSE